MFRAAALLICLSAAGGELETWIERAGGPDWAERERAQRWLATHLAASDAEFVAGRAARGDAELRARVARAIGGETRLVDLAARLSLAREPAAAELGREALREQILAFDPGAEAAQSPSLDWLWELRDRFPERWHLSAGAAAAGPRACLDLFARNASFAPALVLDPLAPAPHEAAEAVARDGTLPELLLECASANGLSVLGFGFGPEDQGRPWILLAPAQPGTQPTAAERMQAWVLGAVDGARADEERAACARALAATGWPAALALLESRWLAGDAQALEGVLLAAGRGRVSPALQDPGRERELYARLAPLCANAEDGAALARASSIALALAAAGPLARTGEALGPLALENFERATPREQWLRLSILERQGRAFPEALATADALLAARATPAPLVIAALRLCAALAGATARTPSPADPRAALDWAADPGRLAELRTLWIGLALPWPAGWNGLEARGSALAPEARAFLCEVAWRTGERERAMALAKELGADRTPRTRAALVALLDRLAAAAPAAARELADALDASPAALLAGLASGPREEALLARWLADGPQSGEEALAFATQAAGARGAEVRAKLIEALGSALPLDERVGALDRAVFELERAGEAALVEPFAAAARERARALAEPELRARLRPGRWPAPFRGPARDLERDEREVGSW